MKAKNRIRRLVIDGMLTALFCVLSGLSIKLGNSMKFTLEALPVLIAGLLLGPADGLAVGTLGSFIYQVFLSGYGIDPTTPLYILPHALSGLLVGFAAKKKGWEYSPRWLSVTASLSAILVTALNTVANYANAKLFHWDYAFWATLPARLLIGIGLAVVFSFVLPPVLNAVRKTVDVDGMRK